MKPKVLRDMSPAQRAARLAWFADMAYKPDEAQSTGCILWSKENASGIISVNGHSVVIAIAGSNDKPDWRNNADWFSQSIGDWSEANGIAVIPEAKKCRSTAGFLAHTALAFKGIEEHLQFVDLSRKSVYLVGHSLGSVPAQLLQCTVLFEDAAAVVYGAPRCVWRGDRLPEAKRISVKRIADQVTYLPVVCQHPPAQTIYVQYPGRVRSKLPARYKALAGGYAVAATVRSLIHQAFGKDDAIWDGHLMSGYKNDLEYLR